jgi:hypothetical protein
VGGEPESKHQETKDHQAVPAGRPQGTPRKGRQEGAQAHAAFPSCSRREHQVRAREGRSLFLSGNILVKYHTGKNDMCHQAEHSTAARRNGKCVLVYKYFISSLI